MVSVTEALANSYAAQLQRLNARIVEIASHASAEAGFIHYIFSQVSEVYCPEGISDLVTANLTSFSTAPELASVGYHAAIQPEKLSSRQKQEWLNGFDRLRGRDPLPADRQSFAFRPLELFGLSLGAASLAARMEYQEWFDSFLKKLPRLVQDDWALWMLSASRIVLSLNDKSSIRLSPADLPIDELALLLWLKASRAFFDRGAWSQVEYGAMQEAILLKCAVSDPEPLDAARAALMYFAIRSSVYDLLRSQVAERWQVGRSEKDAIELVITICRRFHGLARQLSIRHEQRGTFEVRDEYDVQDLMRSVLTLFFDDVREEEWTPSYAGNASRVDFLLWREHVVVETKMTRRGLNQKKVADELIVDKERYKSHSRCRVLICFVYDPEHYCRNPAALENELRQEENPIVRVIVAPRD